VFLLPFPLLEHHIDLILYVVVLLFDGVVVLVLEGLDVMGRRSRFPCAEQDLSLQIVRVGVA